MTHTYTLDASVFLNAFNPFEVGHQESNELLTRLQTQGAPLIAPTLLLPEVAAAISRGRNDENLARQFVAALSNLPHLILTPLDKTLAQQAAEVAVHHHLRGSDAVYAAVALRFGATLVTLDREQRQRVAAAVTAYYPTEALAELNQAA